MSKNEFIRKFKISNYLYRVPRFNQLNPVYPTKGVSKEWFIISDV